MSRLRAGLAAVAALAILVGIVPQSATAATTRLALADVKAVNYYPSSHGWTTMWSAFDAAEHDRDMARIASLGANAVRFVVQPSAFGYPIRPEVASRLAQAIDIADRNGLAVQLTLFDWFSSYADIEASKGWATSLLAPYADDPRIWSIELQNELPVENPLAVAWAAALLPHLDQLTTSPTTVSVNGAPLRLQLLETALGAVQPDFWSYHYYDSLLASSIDSAFRSAKSIAAPLPLHIGETGESSYPKITETAATAEARQDHFLRAAFAAAKANGLPAPAPWTLWDFTPTGIPYAASANQYRFGLFRTDGTAKPAATSVTRAFTTGVIDLGFNGSFENASPSMPAEWLTYLGEQATVAVDSTTARTGSRSLRMSKTLGDSTGWPAVWTSPIVSLQQGRTYTAKVWAKGKSVTGTNRLGLTWYDASGKYLGVSTSSAVPTGSSSWRQLTATGTPPVGAVAVLIQLQSTRNTGTVWFDDVTFG